MKQLTILATLSLAAILSACDNGTSPQQKTSTTASTSVDLKVINWGPQSTTVGVIPNKQPGGGMGIWIEVSGTTQGLGEAQVLFAGQPAMVTSSVQEKGLSAAIAPEQLTEPGKKEVVIKQISTNKLFPVGVFDVQPAK
jgi:hypothetical protein